MAHTEQTRGEVHENNRRTAVEDTDQRMRTWRNGDPHSAPRASFDTGPLDEQEQQIRDTYSGITPDMVRGAIDGAKALVLGYTGLSPDAPIDTNESGGQQSKVEGRFDLIPPVAMFELAQVMQHGAERYAPRNWYKIPLDSHLNHLLMHAFAYLAGDRQEDHLTHVLARAAMAVEIAKLGEQAEMSPAEKVRLGIERAA